MNRRWTKEQIQILEEKYAIESWETLESLLFPFKREDITHKAYKLGIKREIHFWTDHEVEFLKNNYNTKSNKEIALFLNKTEGAIISKADNLGLIISNKWTDSEISYLISNYENMSNKKLMNTIKRSTHCIIDKARELGLRKKVRDKKYDPNEFLNNVKQFAEKLGRTPLVTEIFKQDWAMPNASLNRYFGGYRNVCKLLDLDINMNIFGSKVPTYKSKNNDLCWSKSELIITNFLIDNNIKYQKEVHYRDYSNDPRFGTKTCDWIINNCVFVEYFGMLDKDYYYIKSQYKIILCDENSLRLIQLNENDLCNLKTIFNEFILN